MGKQCFKVIQERVLRFKMADKTLRGCKNLQVRKASNGNSFFEKFYMLSTIFYYHQHIPPKPNSRTLDFSSISRSNHSANTCQLEIATKFISLHSNLLIIHKGTFIFQA